MPVLLIHGGAGTTRSTARRQAIAATLDGIARAGWAMLAQGGSALDVVVEAARLLEDEPLFNAGRGSKLQCDGAARLSASLMDGTVERFSGIVNTEGLLNPILLCRHLLDERDRVLAGVGALERGRALGLEEGDLRTDEAIANWKAAQSGETGTIGAVALDDSGRLAASTSTGGRGMERVGRVSDSCTVAGNFASAFAAVSCTGIGEDIVDGALAARLATMVEGGASLETATAQLEDRMNRHDWRAGLIGVDATGAWTTMHTTESLSWHAVVNGVHHDFLDTQ